MAEFDNEQQEEVQTNEMEIEGVASAEQADLESTNPQNSDSIQEMDSTSDPAEAEAAMEEAEMEEVVESEAVDEVMETEEFNEAKNAAEVEETSSGVSTDVDADEVASEDAETEMELVEVADAGASEVSIDPEEVAESEEAIAAAALIASQTTAEEEEVAPEEAETELELDEVADAGASEVSVDPEEVAESEEAIAAAALIASQTTVEAEEVVEETPAAAAAEDDRHWYVVHCYSGYENKVQHNLEQRIETMGMKDRIFDVVVPTEEEIEVKEGKRRTVERRVFPGYILVQMILSEESWYVVRNTPGVTGFVGMGNEPTPLRPEEVSSIIKRMEADAPRIKLTYAMGQRVRIIDGPFNDFIGTVDDIDMERAKVRVMVSFFGRETPVELDFLQVEKS